MDGWYRERKKKLWTDNSRIEGPLILAAGT